jgi:hypothetical protein
MIIGIVTTAGLRWYLVCKNERKERDSDSKEAAQMRVIDIEHIGDAHPDFVYYV